MRNILIGAVFLFFLFGCSNNKTINESICPQCNMPIASKKDSAKVINGKDVTFFDDVGCAILWLKEKNIEVKNIKFMVYSIDSKKYIDGEDAFYSINDKTPMNYGFGAYEQKKAGFIDFKEMQIKMFRGENLTDPKIRKKVLGY